MGMIGCVMYITKVDHVTILAELSTEIRSLPDRITGEREREQAYLKYTEVISKNKPEGLKGHKAKPKVALHHANQGNQYQCFVQLFKLYNSVCPGDLMNACWLSKQPVGHTTLNDTVIRSQTMRKWRDF